MSVCLQVDHPGGSAELKEPEKCAEWRWCAPDALPEPHFEASRTAIRLWLSGRLCAHGLTHRERMLRSLPCRTASPLYKLEYNAIFAIYALFDYG